MNHVMVPQCNVHITIAAVLHCGVEKILWGQLQSHEGGGKFIWQGWMEIYHMCSFLLRKWQHWTGTAIAPWLLNLKTNRQDNSKWPLFSNYVLNNFQVWYSGKNPELRKQHPTPQSVTRQVSHSRFKIQ